MMILLPKKAIGNKYNPKFIYLNEPLKTNSVDNAKHHFWR